MPVSCLEALLLLILLHSGGRCRSSVLAQLAELPHDQTLRLLRQLADRQLVAPLRDGL